MNTPSDERPRVEPRGDAFDLIIRSGTVIDGTGRPSMTADVGIAGGRIRAVGDLSDASAPDEIDARGLTVSPGFIDVHSHSDFTLTVDGRAQSALAQGVTTELVGNCGHGCSPLGDDPAFAANIFGYDSAGDLDWRTTSEYLARLERSRPAINVGTLMPLGNLRLAAMDDAEQVSTPEERRRMMAFLDEGLEAGAFGLSSGLQYPDSVQTQADETADLARSVARHGGLYAACVRHTDELAVEGLTEAIDTGRSSGVKVQISHAMQQPGSPPDMEQRTYDLVEAGRRDDVDVAFDMHTRPFGELNLSTAPAGLGGRRRQRSDRPPARRSGGTREDQGVSQHDPALLPGARSGGDVGRGRPRSGPARQEHRRADAGGRRSARHGARHPPRRSGRHPSPAGDDDALHRGRHGAVLPAPAVLAGLGRDDAQPRRAARACGLPRGLHVGRLVPPADRPGASRAHSPRRRSGA